MPRVETLRTRRPWVSAISLVVVAVGIGLWIDLESGFSLLRGATLARGVVGIIGLGLLGVAAEVTGDAINTRDRISDGLPRRVAHLTLLLASAALFGGLFWLWPRVLGVAQ
jgi:hypothetical protein